MLEMKKKICRKSAAHVSNKEKFAEPWRERGAPDEMDQKSNLKFNQISKFRYVRRMFRALPLERAFEPQRFYLVSSTTRWTLGWTTSTRFFSRNSMFLAKEEGKGMEAVWGRGVERRDYYLGIYQPSFEWKSGKKRNKSRGGKRNCMGVVTLRFYFRERWIHQGWSWAN